MMQFRIFLISLVFGLVAAPVLAQTDEDKAAFKAAYARYNAAVEAADAEAAANAAGEALNLGKKIYPDDSPSLAALYLNVGYALADSGRFDAAIDPLESGIDLMEEIYGKEDGRLAEPLWVLLEALAEERESEKSVRNWKKLRSVIERASGPESMEYAEATLRLGIASFNNYGHRDSAMRYFAKARKLFENLSEQPKALVGVTAFWQGKAAQSRGHRGIAEKLYLESIDILDNADPGGHEYELMAHAFLVALLQDRGKDEEATYHCRAISKKRPKEGVDGYKPLYKVIPTFPQEPLRKGLEGYVLVEFTVDDDGTVKNPFVVQSGPPGYFEEAAMAAVEQFRYAPAVKDGQLIETPGVRNLITFKLAR